MAGDNRFPRTERLLTGAEFSRVFADSRRSSDRYFTILARPNEFRRPRLGMAISKRVAKRAVDRNRLRRVVREVFRTQSALAAQDYVVLARAAAASATSAEVRLSLERLFARAGTPD